MKNKKILITLLFAILITIFACFIVFGINNKEDNKKTKNSGLKAALSENEQGRVDNKKQIYSFNDENGNKVEIKADKIVTATGFAGASNYQFYIIDNNLYFENISISDSKEKLASGVNDIYLKGENIVAKLNANGKILKENNYVTYE